MHRIPCRPIGTASKHESLSNRHRSASRSNPEVRVPSKHLFSFINARNSSIRHREVSKEWTSVHSNTIEARQGKGWLAKSRNATPELEGNGDQPPQLETDIPHALHSPQIHTRPSDLAQSSEKPYNFYFKFPENADYARKKPNLYFQSIRSGCSQQKEKKQFQRLTPDKADTLNQSLTICKHLRSNLWQHQTLTDKYVQKNEEYSVTRKETSRCGLFHKSQNRGNKYPQKPRESHTPCSDAHSKPSKPFPKDLLSTFRKPPAESKSRERIFHSGLAKVLHSPNELLRSTPSPPSYPHN